MLGPPGIAVASESSEQPAKRLGPLLAAQAALVVVVAAVLGIVFFREHEPVSSIGLKPLSPVSFAWGLGLAAFFVYVYAPAAYRTLRRLGLGGFEKGFARLQGLPVWYLILAVAIGGAAEEILYRGYAVDRIAALSGSLWLGGSISVVVFALAHEPMWGWGPAAATLVSGGIFTAFFLWQRDLGANIIAHVVTDLAGIALRPLLARRRAP